ncbi:MAG: hypothetical protein ACJ790_12420 [Myxococcaceae bacterium]
MKKLLLFVALLPGLAFAAPSISVMPFTGKKASVARDELVGKLCDDVECVPQAKASKGGKPDFAKGKKLKLTHFVTGKVVGKKLEITVQTTAKKSKLKKAYPITAGGKFSGGALDSAVADVRGAIGAPKKKKEEPVAEETPPVEEKKPPEEEKKPPVEEHAEKKKKEEPVEEKKKEEPREETAREEKKEEPPEEKPTHYRGRPPLVIVQLGTDFGLRVFSYSNVQTSNLRAYSAYFIFMPRLHGELYPLARLMHGIPSGLGLEADYSFAIGLQSSPTGGPSYPTNLTRFDFAARLRMTPTDGPLVVNPFIGYRTETFSTKPAADGSRLTGLADIGYSALRIGATVEQPLMDDQAAVYGELALLPVLGTGALKDYFPKAGGFGFEVGVGGAYTLVQKLQLRAGYTLTYYRLGFTVAPTDTYRAGGASDLYGALTLALRYTY